MKKSTLFKSIAAAALFMVGIAANAQVTTSAISKLPDLKDIYVATDVETTSPEKVSVNAFMPYMVIRDKTIFDASTLFNASVFKWTNTGGLTFKKSDGTTDLTASNLTATGYFIDTTVYLKMPSSPTNFDITVLERSRPKFNKDAGCEQTTGKTLNIQVVDLPTQPTAVNDIGSCGTDATYTLPYDFNTVTATFPYYIKYTITHTNLAGTSDGTSKTYYYRIADKDGTIVIPKADLLAVQKDGTTPTELASGRYVVTFDNVWDQISVKALNRETTIAGSTTAVTGTRTVGIVKLPTPATGDIQHIKNLE